MQSACSGGTGTFIEKTARKLQISPESGWPQMPYDGMSLHKVSSKCGIFAETDANTLVKTGVPVEEIIASLFEAVVYQNLATLTKGNTPMPEVLLLGGPNLFFKGLQEAWRHHLDKLWAAAQGRAARGPRRRTTSSSCPTDALYYACLGCVEIGDGRSRQAWRLPGRDKLRWWVDEGQHEQKAKDGGKGLVSSAERSRALRCAVRDPSGGAQPHGPREPRARMRARRAGPDRLRLRQHHRQGGRALAGARAALQLLRAVARAIPIEDAQSLFRQVREAGLHRGRRARAHRLRQGPAEGHPGRRRGAWWRRWRTPPPRSTSSPTPT